MRIFRSTGKFVYKTFLDVPSWISFQQLKQNTSGLAGILKDIFTPQPPAQKTNFKEAMKKFNLSEEDLAKRSRTYFRQSMLFLGCGCLCIAYVFYLFFTRHFLAGLIALLASGLFFVQAFSAHFWHFQIKHRKLGCTFKEWFNGRIDEEQQ